MIPVQHNIPDVKDIINRVEAEILSEAQVECELLHDFYGGMYVRQVTMPAGTKVSGQTQKFDHTFALLSGVLQVFTEEEGWLLHIAPLTGRTKAGTKRVAIILSETKWVTYHVTNIKPKDDTYESLMEAVAEVEREIFEPIDNPYVKMEVVS